MTTEVPSTTSRKPMIIPLDNLQPAHEKPQTDWASLFSKIGNGFLGGCLLDPNAFYTMTLDPDPNAGPDNVTICGSRWDPAPSLEFITEVKASYVSVQGEDFAVSIYSKRKTLAGSGRGTLCDNACKVKLKYPSYQTKWKVDNYGRVKLLECESEEEEIIVDEEGNLPLPESPTLPPISRGHRH
jgi:hypothetical protein